MKKYELIAPGCVTLLLTQHTQDNHSMILNTGDISTKVFYPSYDTEVSDRRFRAQQQTTKRLETERKEKKKATKPQPKSPNNLGGKR